MEVKEERDDAREINGVQEQSVEQREEQRVV